MPWRVAAATKIVVCVTTSSGSRPGTAVPSRPAVVSQPQRRQLHVPTQTSLLTDSPARRTVSLSLSTSPPLYQSFHLSHHRHQRADLTKMDAALAKIFVSNSQWVEAVNSAEPGFFEQSAKGQSPKVRAITTFLLPPRAAMVASSSEEILSFSFYVATLCSILPFPSITDRSSGSDAPTLASQKVS